MTQELINKIIDLVNEQRDSQGMITKLDLTLEIKTLLETNFENNGVLDDVIKQSEQLTFDCEWCEDTGVMITGMDCTCDKAPSKS